MSFCYYMKPIEIKVARIGNSRGIRRDFFEGTSPH